MRKCHADGRSRASRRVLIDSLTNYLNESINTVCAFEYPSNAPERTPGVARRDTVVAKRIWIGPFRLPGRSSSCRYCGSRRQVLSLLARNGSPSSGSRYSSQQRTSPAESCRMSMMLNSKKIKAKKKSYIIKIEWKAALERLKRF